MLIVRDCDESLARGFVDFIDLNYSSCIYGRFVQQTGSSIIPNLSNFLKPIFTIFIKVGRDVRSLVQMLRY